MCKLKVTRIQITSQYQCRILTFTYFRLVLTKEKKNLMSLFYLCTLQKMKICNKWVNKGYELWQNHCQWLLQFSRTLPDLDHLLKLYRNSEGKEKVLIFLTGWIKKKKKVIKRQIFLHFFFRDPYGLIVTESGIARTELFLFSSIRQIQYISSVVFLLFLFLLTWQWKD